MQFLNTIAFASLAAYVLADQSFGLTAKGDNIDTPVTVAGAVVGLENGNPAQIDLQEPSGYATIDGQRLALSPGGLGTTHQEGEASKDFGVVDGKFRSGPSEDKADWWACKADTGYTLVSYQKDECTKVALLVGPVPNHSASPSSAAPSSAAPSSAAPTTTQSKGNLSTSAHTETKTQSESTLVTITSCAPEHTDCPAKSSAVPAVSTATNGAVAMQVGAGFVAAAAAAMLV